MKDYEKERLDKYTAHWAPIGRETTLYGLSVSTFTTEQLLAVIGHLGHRLQEAQKTRHIAWQKGFRSADMY